MTGGDPEATGTPQTPDPAETADAPATDQAPPASAVDTTRFAHASEAEMARILDFYDVRWHYEPTTFPILWNLDGDVVESFAPDFYLPDMDVYLEMTTLKQRLVRKKNRKLRRLRELYPDIRIKLFYARDFRAMMLKYGRLGLAESLSGTVGQVVPERAAPRDAVIATVEAARELPAVLEIEPAAALPAEAVPATPLPVTLPGTRDDVASTATPAVPRATPRTRSARRRRARAAIKAGAEQETTA